MNRWISFLALSVIVQLSVTQRVHAFGSKAPEVKTDHSHKKSRSDIEAEERSNFSEYGYEDNRRVPASAAPASGEDWYFDTVERSQSVAEDEMRKQNQPKITWNAGRNYGKNHQYSGRSMPEYSEPLPGSPVDVSLRYFGNDSNQFGRGIASIKSEPIFSVGQLNNVPAEKAIRNLRLGNQRFTQGQQQSSRKGTAQKDRIRLLAGESPKAIIVTTSDSRVSPELVFDQRLGDLFVIRVLGPALDRAVIASIEYAVATLGVQLVLILGSESSAGVQAAMMNPPGADLGSPYGGHLIKDIQRRLFQFRRTPASTGFSAEGAANARGIVKDLIQQSSLLRTRVSEAKLQIHSAMYSLDSGLVDFH